MSFSLDDYVDVAERIASFYERFPDGRLTSGSPPYPIQLDGKTFVVYHARAYRTPDDPHPGDGWAWEPVPGPTQFTRDSELQNAETAAWGRAIVALGFETKKIASRQEVRARQESDSAAPSSPAVGNGPRGETTAPAESDFPVEGDLGDPVVQFGKHKGKRVSQLPDPYKRWLVENFEPKSEQDNLILQAVKDDLAVPF